MRKYTFGGIIILLFTGAVMLYAYRGTWGKTDIEFRIHINEQLVQESTYGEPPTFAIWLEDPKTGLKRTVFVTRRAAEGDWEGKATVPVALPLWFEVFKKEFETDDLPGYDHRAPMAVTGATPQPGYFKTRARVKSGSRWTCWIEVNLSGDYNEYYQEYDSELKKEDEYATGQPAIVYKTEIVAEQGFSIVPELAGMTVKDSVGGILIKPLQGITSAGKIFNEISLNMVSPNPKIIETKY